MYNQKSEPNQSEVSMHIVKMIGMIFLAIFLILLGVTSIFEATPGMFVKYVMELLAVSSGILILISIGSCVPHKE